jgi:hypothetical protein
MSTHYDRVPTLEERIRASRLIVTGRVKSIEPLPQARIGEVDEEQAIAHIAVSNVLLGSPATRELDVRFVRARGGDTRAASHPFREDQRLVLLLVPDVGPDTRPNTYVAYLRGAYPLTANDAFQIETEPEASKGGASRKARMTLNSLRDAVKMIGTEETAEMRAWSRLEPQLAKRPSLPPVTELPHEEHRAGPTSAGPVMPDAPRPGRKR